MQSRRCLVALMASGLSTNTGMRGKLPFVAQGIQVYSTSCVFPMLNAGMISLPLFVTQMSVT